MKSLFEHFEILEVPRDIRGKKHDCFSRVFSITDSKQFMRLFIE